MRLQLRLVKRREDEASHEIGETRVSGAAWGRALLPWRRDTRDVFGNRRGRPATRANAVRGQLTRRSRGSVKRNETVRGSERRLRCRLESLAIGTVAPGNGSERLRDAHLRVEHLQLDRLAVGGRHDCRACASSLRSAVGVSVIAIETAFALRS